MTASLHTGTGGAGGQAGEGGRACDGASDVEGGLPGEPKDSSQGGLRPCPWALSGARASRQGSPHLPVFLSAITSLTTRWPSCRNGATRALVLSSGGPKVTERGTRLARAVHHPGCLLCPASAPLLGSPPAAPLPPFLLPHPLPLPAATLYSWFGMLVGGSGSSPSLVPRISAVRV